MELKCTSLLDAVNLCLEGIGEQPVNVIPSSGVTEATIAYSVVARINREIQNQRLHCNTEEDYPFLPDIQGYINVPSNVLQIDPSDPNMDFVQRGSRLYNRTTHSFTFTQSVKCDVVWHFPFEDLPEHVRHYIAVRAARVFQRNYVGSTNLNAMSGEDEQKALLIFREGEDRTDDRTMLESNPVNLILNRRA